MKPINFKARGPLTKSIAIIQLKSSRGSVRDTVKGFLKILQRAFGKGFYNRLGSLR
jgi:hypothetical protein